MFDELRGKIDAKRDIISIDQATGLALSPFAFKMIDQIRKKKEKLTKSVQNKSNQVLADKLSECLSSMSIFNGSYSECKKDTIEEAFNSFYLDTKKSDLIKLYRSLIDSQTRIAGRYNRAVQKVEQRLFRYFSGVGLYVDIDIRKNSDVTRLDPALRDPPRITGLEKLYDHIPKNIRDTLPSVSDVN